MAKKPDPKTTFNSLADKGKEIVKKAPATSATFALSILPGTQLIFLPFAVAYDLYQHGKNKGKGNKQNKYDPRNKK